MGNIYTKMKVFHFKDKLMSLPKDVEQILAPVHIRIKPTNICNHNCHYCSYRAGSLQLGKDMELRDQIPQDKMLEIIDDLIEMGVKAVTFSGGGEPLVYPHILEAIKKLSGSSIKFATLTNGSRLQGEVADIFAQHGTWVRVSIDGWDGGSYARYRGVNEKEFSKVLQNMENFKKLGGHCFLGVSLIVDQENAPHVYDFIHRLSSIGVDSVKVSPCILGDDSAENNAYHKPLFDAVQSQIMRAVRDFAGRSFEIFNAYHEFEMEFDKAYQWCPYQQILPVIGADLNIYPCQDKAYNLDEGLIGSIKDCRFKDFWMKDKHKFFKINPSQHCRHHCVANAKNQLVLEYLNADQEHLGFV
jgi:MoaA/NifB/PqqE/SkfB family radical SAM enzyme